MQVVAPEGWIAKRLAVAVAILILYIVHYVTLGLIHGMGKGEKSSCIAFQVHAIYIILLALLSMTYIQTSVFSTVLAWLTLIPLIILHFTSFAQEIPKVNSQKDNLWIAYYFLQFVWFTGIIIDFYSE